MDTNVKTCAIRNFTIDGKDRDVQLLLSKLRFLSKIQKGEKLQIVSKLSLVDGGSWYNAFIRTVGGGKESREHAFEFIQQVCEEGLEVASFFFGSGDTFQHEVGMMIIAALKESQVGIKNHMDTYKTDRMFGSTVETFINILNAKLGDLENKAKILPPPVVVANKAPVRAVPKAVQAPEVSEEEDPNYD